MYPCKSDEAFRSGLDICHFNSFKKLHGTYTAAKSMFARLEKMATPGSGPIAKNNV